MGEENSSNSNTMNLDLNLGPTDNSSEPPSSGSGSGSYMNLEDWLDGPPPVHHHRVREVGRHRNHRWRSLWRQLPIPPETRNLALELIGGEGSVASEERPSSEVVKICENGSGYVEEGEGVGKKKDGGKNNGDEGSFFDCNICLDLAKDPVVTCCGHLFCWPCLYRWLHHHSDAKECPVCKGEVTTKNVTPIYGRANNNNNNSSSNNVREADMDMDNPTLKIPIRPPARRVESWRQTIQRSAFSIPMEEMIRRLGSTFDLNRELAQLQSQSRNPDDESSNTLLNRILTSRGMRRERGPSDDHDHVIDLTESSPPPQRRFSSLLLRRSSNSHRAAENLAVVESYFQSQSNPPPPPPVERNLELPPPFPFPFLPFDDRDSVSSIAAVIHSESQTMDNAIEIDSTVALSTSSSRRRNNNDAASRISDVDSGDSRAPRRRRFN